MKFYTYKGKRLSIIGWSRELGVPSQRIASRLRRGLSFRIAISPARLARPDISPTIEFQGKQRTLREWARKLKLPYYLLYNRYTKGFPPEQILSRQRLPSPRNQHHIFLQKNGKRATVQEWAKKLGIPANTIYQRLHRCKGNPPDVEAILVKQMPTSRKGKTGRIYEVHGMAMTVPQWAEHLHCTTTILYRRLSQGLPLEQVFAPAMEVGRKLFYTKDGITLSLSGWAKRLGLSIHALRRRRMVTKDLGYVLSPRRPGGFAQHKN